MEENRTNITCETEEDCDENVNSSSVKPIHFICCLIAVVALVLTAMGVKNYIYAEEYRQALECIANNEYARAKTLLLEYVYDDYKDADELYQFCMGCIAYENEKLDTAYRYVNNLSFSYIDIIEQKKMSAKISIIKEEYRKKNKTTTKSTYKTTYTTTTKKTTTTKTTTKETTTTQATTKKTTTTQNVTRRTSTQNSTSKKNTTKKTTTKRTTTKKTTTKKSDPYNANKYKNEEDFYEDHYDDFFDYYDAEKYYKQHHND